MDTAKGYVNISFIYSCMIAFTIPLILIITVKVLIAKYSRTRILNKLTLIPFYNMIAYLGLVLLQVSLLVAADALSESWYQI